MKLPLHLLGISLLLGLFPSAQSAPLTILNHSFETPGTPNGTFSGSQTLGPSGWSVYNTGPTNGDRFFGVWDPTGTLSYTPPIPDGQQIGVVFLDDTLGLEAGLVQVLGDTLDLSTQYSLLVGIGNFAPSIGDLWDFTGFPGYRVELLAGSTVLAVDNNTLAPSEGQFLTSTVSFSTGAAHANAGQPLAIRLVNLNGSGVEVNFDNVRLDAVSIPEPSVSVFLAGAAFLISIFRNQRKGV